VAKNHQPDIFHPENGMFFLLETHLPTFIELDDGKNDRKDLYLMLKTMVSSRFSLKPIH
jgi:hypothetical protein